jgi:hypothetical protein
MFLKGDSRLLRLQLFNKTGVCLVDAGKKDSGSKYEVQISENERFVGIASFNSKNYHTGYHYDF